MNYPKILIVGQSFNHINGGGITLTNLFTGWDKDRIAVAAERINFLELSICENYYQLGYSESKRRFPFNMIEKKFPSGKINVSQTNGKNTGNVVANSEKNPGFAKLYDMFLHNLGLYHYSRRLRLTKELRSWIKDFDPDIIYSQLSSLALIKFINLLYEEFDKKIAIHMMDDWPKTISTKGLLKNFWKKKIDKEFRLLLKRTSIFMTISEAMSEEYLKRYNKNSVSFHNPIETKIWNNLTHKKFDKSNLTFLYTGRIGLGIEKSLYEIAQAIRQINENPEINITFILQTRHTPAWTSEFYFIKQRFVEYSLYPNSLTDADLLILPYDFSKEAINFIRYSFPTKASEYMISGTPILLFASEETALCKHALKNEWALTVTKNDLIELKQSILYLINNEKLRIKISLSAKEFAKEHFESENIRRKFVETFLFEPIKK